MPPKSAKPGVPRKSIHVFDLDDTLIQTDARVRVRDAAGTDVRALTPAEFTAYALRPGEIFDFRDFSDVGILSRGTVLKYTRAIIEALMGRGTHSDFGILTARGDKRLHAAFLRRLFAGLFGIRLKNSLIFALSDDRFARHMEGRDLPGPFRGKRYAELRIPERKALVIARDLVARGYNDISLYDDSRENLTAFKVIREAFPGVSYKPHFIDPTWHLRLEEFRRAASSRKALTRGRDSALLILENHSGFREDPQEGLRVLEREGRVPLGAGDVVLCKQGAKFSLEKRH